MIFSEPLLDFRQVKISEPLLDFRPVKISEPLFVCRPNIWTGSTMGVSIKEELEQMQSNPSDDFKCLALKSKPYDWQFAIRGPNGTEFEGGIYHGRIQFSDPDKPPIFTLLTENGRFKTQTEISLNRLVPFGSVRQALIELIELLPTYPDGALGSIEYDKEERRTLSIKSRVAPIYGTEERQQLINEIHEYMLSKVPPVPSNEGGDQNDRDRRKQKKRKIDERGGILIVGNTINATNCGKAGIFDFANMFRSLWQRS